MCSSDLRKVTSIYKFLKNAYVSFVMYCGGNRNRDDGRYEREWSIFAPGGKMLQILNMRQVANKVTSIYP